MNKLDKENIIGLAALLVHAAKIDEIYSNHEKDLIKDFIKSYLIDEDINGILNKAEEMEKNSNQLLNYTNIIKKNSPYQCVHSRSLGRLHQRTINLLINLKNPY